MKANELRIGNYVNHCNSIKQVDALLFLEILKYTTPFEPIPLTEEWLLRFGFIEVYDNNFQDDDSVLWCDLGQDTVSIICPMPWVMLKHIKHVHSLQNLYFALTGEELKIQQP